MTASAPPIVVVPAYRPDATLPDLVRALGRLVPDAVVERAVALGQAPGQRDDLGQGDLHDRPGVRERGVERRDTVRGGGLEVDLVGADAERADRDEVRCGLDDAGGHVGLGPDAEDVDALERLDQLGLVHGPGSHGHVDAGGLEDRGGEWVQVFEEEGA